MIDLKLCGNHSLSDFQVVTKSKRANYIGVIFADSKRQVNPHDLKDWLKKAPLPSYQKLVGVFVNPSLTEVSEVLQHVPLDLIQCHGNETVETILSIKEAFELPVFKAIHHQKEGWRQLKQYEGVVDGYVVDSKVKGAWGGTGIKFEWESIPCYLKEANRQGVTCLIAGGINAENVDGCIVYHPHGIDLSSGIEVDGRKSEEQLQRLEERMKQYEQRLS
jgi:phosphoribosylanthranilate isomerase